MLADLLLAGIITAPLSSFALFLPTRRRRRTSGTWPAVRRMVSSLIGTVVLAAVIAGALILAHAPLTAIEVTVAAYVVVSLLWLPATRRWNARGHLTWASSFFLFLSYLSFIFWWTFASHLGLWSTIGGLLLWAFEVLAALLASAYLWELCDALGRERWRRRITRDTPVYAPPEGLPFVSLQVPAHNEPPEMVIKTLESLVAIDYPNYEVIVIDDNTDDPAMWRPVEAWCVGHGVKFAHLENWPGYKSGALNYALRELTDPRAELIGVVDSDYHIHPGFLRRCAPLFGDPEVGFIQAPQDYRDWESAPYYRRLYYSYKYFFAVSQPARNEHDGAIFAGTMGLIRRRALEDVGGWDEWCITEDAELSLRLLRGGWSGLHVDQSWGRGVMPLTFEALKSQRYRWCFGGIQILRMHVRSLLPGRRGQKNHLSPVQRWAYLAGGFQWYGDLLGLIFFVFLLAGAANLAAGGNQLFRKLTVFLVATVPVLVALGLVRAIALLRRGTGASWRDALGAFFIWQSTSLVVARASVQGLFAKQAAFLRTPKVNESAPWWESFTANWAESILALLGVLGIISALARPNLGGILLAGLLVFPTMGMAAAPFNSLAAQHAALPAELRARRRTEWQRDRTLARGAVITGGAVTALAAVLAAVALLLAPSPRPVSPPKLISPQKPAKVVPVVRHRPNRSPSPSHSPAPSSSPSASPSSIPSPSLSPSPSASSTLPSATPSSTAAGGTGGGGAVPTSAAPAGAALPGASTSP